MQMETGTKNKRDLRYGHSRAASANMASVNMPRLAARILNPNPDPKPQSPKPPKYLRDVPGVRRAQPAPPIHPAPP